MGLKLVMASLKVVATAMRCDPEPCEDACGRVLGSESARGLAGLGALLVAQPMVRTESGGSEGLLRSIARLRPR